MVCVKYDERNKTKLIINNNKYSKLNYPVKGQRVTNWKKNQNLAIKCL